MFPATKHGEASLELCFFGFFFFNYNIRIVILYLDLWSNIKHTNIHIIGVSGEEKE